MQSSKLNKLIIITWL